MIKVNTKKIIFLIAILIVINAGIILAGEEGGMKLSSSSFKDNELMPARHSLNGGNVSPELVIENIPAGTKSLALIVDDPDAPAGDWVHWLMYDMPVIAKIEEGKAYGKQGVNDFRRIEYGGPCPPSGTHRYVFKIYALNTLLGLKEGVNKKTLEKAMEGHILGKSELVGLYKSGK